MLHSTCRSNGWSQISPEPCAGQLDLGLLHERPEKHPPVHRVVGGHSDRLAALVWDAAAEAGGATPESACDDLPGHNSARPCPNLSHLFRLSGSSPLAGCAHHPGTPAFIRLTGAVPEQTARDRLAAGQGVARDKVEEDFFRSARPTSIIQRLATPEEVAEVVAFVCSPLASAITGTALRVDGGVVRSIA